MVPIDTLAIGYYIDVTLTHMASKPVSAGAGETAACEQCQKLREVYWKAVAEVTRLECLRDSSAPGVAQDLDAQIDAAKQVRNSARDALTTHRLEHPTVP
jgi:hypothetical protein